MIRLLVFTLFASFSISLLAQKNSVDPERQWSVYRGSHSAGFLDNANLPEKWDVEKAQNIKWKIDIPGLALSGPVIWGNDLFLTTAISDSDTSGLRTGIYGDGEPIKDNSVHDFKVYKFNKKTGELIWQRTSYRGVPEVGRHPKATHANCTPVTDGNYVVAFFGSEGLYCYDFEGNLIWDIDFGRLDAGAFDAEWAEWEFASSPIIYKDMVIVQCDVRGESFVSAINVKTGEEIWRKVRDEHPTWCTPNIYQYNGKDYVVLNGYKHRGAYDLATGEERWKMSGGGDVPVPTPIVGENLIYFNSAHGRLSPIYAVKKSAKGDITLKDGTSSNEGVQWSTERGASYMHSLLLYDGYLYNMRWNGQLSCFDPLTGEQIYREKLGKAESFIASPVASDGKIYIPSDEGKVYTVQAGKEFKILNETSLGEVCMVVPAITDGMIIFRTMTQLIAVGK
ncbi:MAG: PQQ-binding-like beta-propeller repeat protein [Bacteroidales bacterium]|nr:PQQ-binding-like beta-propeller repeat protein [Bacteroidales bacterium]